MNNNIKKIIVSILVMLALTIPGTALDVVVGETASFTAIAKVYDNSASHSDKVRVVFDWDDGTQTTSAYVGLGTKVNQTHVWEKTGVYEVKVKAVAEDGESKWFTIEKVNVLASDPRIIVWLADVNDTAISGIVDLWSEKIHIEKKVNSTDPLEYILEPGNYTIRGRASGFQNMEHSFNIAPGSLRPQRMILRMRQLPVETQKNFRFRNFYDDYSTSCYCNK